MKVSLLLSVIVPLVGAFQAPLTHPLRTATELYATKKQNANPMAQVLTSLANNFQPLHGHGSLEKDLDEQWDSQQALLKERNRNHVDKTHLKQKYKNPEKVKFDGRVGDSKKSSFGKNISP